MASTKRTWLWVVLGIIATFVLVVIVFVGGAIFEFRTHVRNEYLESSAAEQQFAQVRSRFVGQQPLIEFVGQDTEGESTIHRPAADAPRVRINNLRVLIYDFRQGHLIHADVPGWLMRMMPSDQFSTYGSDEFTRHRLTIEDIERHGLGLVLEGRNDNTRIIIWTE